VGSVAISLLARLGYRVVASTGRLQEAEFLRSLGAADVVSRDEFSSPGKPLAKERFAGVVDAVGSHTLANACAATRYGGAVAACGLAQGMDFPGSVAPFILRGVTLYGIDSVMAPMAVRQAAWAQLASTMDLARLDALTTEVGLSQAVAQGPEILAGRVRGRLVVNVDA
jgi:acrylyl-CoA reductase (NADPH)